MIIELQGEPACRCRRMRARARYMLTRRSRTSNSRAHHDAPARDGAFLGSMPSAKPGLPRFTPTQHFMTSVAGDAGRPIFSQYSLR